MSICHVSLMRVPTFWRRPLHLRGITWTAILSTKNQTKHASDVFSIALFSLLQSAAASPPGFCYILRENSAVGFRMKETSARLTQSQSKDEITLLADINKVQLCCTFH